MPKEKVFTPTEALQMSALLNQNISRAEFEKYIRTDMQAAANVIADVLANSQVFALLVDGYYQRYLELKESDKNQLPLLPTE